MENKVLTLLQGSEPVFQPTYSPLHPRQLFFVCGSKDFALESNVSSEFWLSKESHSPEVTSTLYSINMPWRNNMNKQQERLYGDPITNKTFVPLAHSS